MDREKQWDRTITFLCYKNTESEEIHTHTEATITLKKCISLRCSILKWVWLTQQLQFKCPLSSESKRQDITYLNTELICTFRKKKGKWPQTGPTRQNVSGLAGSGPWRGAGSVKGKSSGDQCPVTSSPTDVSAVFFQFLVLLLGSNTVLSKRNLM